MARMTADCGHTVEDRPYAVAGTGYAITSGDRTICYPCADQEQVDALRDLNLFVGYLSSDSKRVTTWAGGLLARVTEARPRVSARKIYVRATDVHGQRWHGSGPLESGTYVTLRRSKAKV